jgi:hypothetical protein
MRPIPKTIYQTPDEIDADIRALELDSLQLAPDTDEHREIMKRIAQLRSYAAAKRWLAGPSK